MFNKAFMYYFSAHAYVQNVSHKFNKFQLKTKASTTRLAIFENVCFLLLLFFIFLNKIIAILKHTF